MAQTRCAGWGAVRFRLGAEAGWRLRWPRESLLVLQKQGLAAREGLVLELRDVARNVFLMQAARLFEHLAAHFLTADMLQ